MLLSGESKLIPYHDYEGSGQDQSVEKKNLSCSLLPPGRRTKNLAPCAHAQSGGRRPKSAPLLRLFPQLLGAGNPQRPGGRGKLWPADWAGPPLTQLDFYFPAW